METSFIGTWDFSTDFLFPIAVTSWISNYINFSETNCIEATLFRPFKNCLGVHSFKQKAYGIFIENDVAYSIHNGQTLEGQRGKCPSTTAPSFCFYSISKQSYKMWLFFFQKNGSVNTLCCLWVNAHNRTSCWVVCRRNIQESV